MCLTLPRGGILITMKLIDGLAQRLTYQESVKLARVTCRRKLKVRLLQSGMVEVVNTNIYIPRAAESQICSRHHSAIAGKLPLFLLYISFVTCSFFCPTE